MSRRVVVRRRQALAVLTALVVVVGVLLARAGGGEDDDARSARTAAAEGQGPAQEAAASSTESPASQVPAGDRAAGVLTQEVPRSASGDLVTVPGATGAPGGRDRVLTLRLQVERGLPVDGEAFARTVMETLKDPRGWGVDGWGFARTDDADAADVDLVLASPDLSQRLCEPLDTGGTLSCRVGGDVVLTWFRWVRGAEGFGDDRVTYRRYLVNHEVGHAIGHGHEPCAGPGQPAPVMMQQTKDVGPCVANGWPHP